MELRIEFLLVLMVGVTLIGCVRADDVKSENHLDEDSTSADNHKDYDNSKETFRNLVRPFRMEKLNLIWVKAQQVNK